MRTLILYNLKRRFRNPLTWFIVMIICLMGAMEIKSIDNQRELRTFIHNDSANFTNMHAFDYKIFVDDPEEHPKAIRTTELLSQTHEDIKIAVENNDTHETLRLYTFYHLLYARAGVGEHDRILQLVFDKKMMPIWEDVSGGVPYDSIENFWSLYQDSIDYSMVQINYYYDLYKKDITPVYRDEVNNVTYLYAYFFNHLPKLLAITCILFMYNSISHERKTGSLKMILTQSISRSRYYLAHFIGGCAHIATVLLIPPFIISGIIGLWRGFVTLQYPVLAQTKSLTSLRIIPNYFDTITRQDMAPLHGYTFSHFAPRGPISESLSTHSQMGWISMFQFLGTVMLVTLAFIAFTVAFTQLFSALINHEIVGFIATAVVFGVLFILGKPYTEFIHLNISPFNMANASRILIGTANVSSLGSLLVLLTSTAVLIAAGQLYFKRKGI